MTNQHGETSHTAQLLFLNLSRRFFSTDVCCLQYPDKRHSAFRGGINPKLQYKDILLNREFAHTKKIVMESDK